MPRVMGRFWEIFLVAGRLGLTSFGGPIAHIGYFREEYVVRRKWLDEGTFAELIALCQFLPGPASSQLGMAVGIKRGGLLGGFAAWLGFTLPSALALILFAYGVQELGAQESADWLHGLKIVAVAVVALALWGMGRTLTPDRTRITIAVVAAGALLLSGSIAAQLVVIAGGAVLGLIVLKPPEPRTDGDVVSNGGTRSAAVLLIAFLVLLAVLPLASRLTENLAVDVVDSFYRTGSLVFGGGHVVLPLIEAEVVPPGWVTSDEFLAGYGAAQAVPGPLFTFSAYLGASVNGLTPAWGGGLLALAAIFAPSFLLVPGVLPFWERLRGVARVRQALMGVNAAVVGLLLAALYDPLWTSAIETPADFAVAAAAFALLAFWKAPPWLVVVVTAIAGAAVVQLL
ncbi:MAG: chromate efflux transporter [Dehalococcoidia bacterium]|nr:chromate efflux transporter [Dehalococcoidia bacterium]